MEYKHAVWQNLTKIGSKPYKCAYCGNTVGPSDGYYAQNTRLYIYVCPVCFQPTYFNDHEGLQIPGPSFGNDVGGIPKDVAALYKEARDSMTVGAHTVSVLLCRKLLAHIAVSKGDLPNKTFIEYVEYLAAKGYVPPDGKGWVDHIRKKGNEATHEIKTMIKADAEELITFIEMLLKFIYEFSLKIPPTK